MSIETLLSFRNGDIPNGLGLGVKSLDDYLVYKPNRFCCMVGRPNIGKTFIQFWYFLCLAKKHGLKWGIYSIENEEWVLRMYLIEFLAADNIKNVSEKDIFGYDNWINEHFKFIEPQKSTLEQLLQVGQGLCIDGLFIDPYNALEKPAGNGHDYDYHCIRLIQDYKKKHGSVYINHHPTTPSQRRLITEGDYKGYPDFMRYFDVEGGGKWFNACDSWISLHRFTSHPMDWMNTKMLVEKEKVTQTGGGVTPEGAFIEMEYSFNRFKINNLDPLEDNNNDLNFEQAQEIIF